MAGAAFLTSIFRHPVFAGWRHAVWIGFALFFLRYSWVSEDAYITFRVLDNFFNGHGLRWNINERAQAYTHPLWLLLHIPIEAVLSNLFLTSVLLSAACATGAVALTLATARRPLLITLGLFVVPLLASRAFRDYASSGLENPLSYLLFAAFGYVMLRRYGHPHFWFLCSLTVSLSLLNRLDMILLYAPCLVWLAWTHSHMPLDAGEDTQAVKRPGYPIRWRQVLLGAAPLLLWLVFSLFYYGFLFPNTKYAKLDTGIEAARYIHNGLAYARYTLIMDTATALLLLAPLAFVALGLRAALPAWRPLPMFPVCIALGVCWQVLYTLAVGGDYMLGRFWSVPAFVSAWLAYMFAPGRFTRALPAAAAAVLLLTGAPFPPAKELRKHYTALRVNARPMIDARHVFGGNLFIPSAKEFKINLRANHKFVGWAEKLARKAPPHVEKAHFIGMLGYYSGPGNILLDELGLADPFLARLPARPDPGFFIGHFRRKLPDGYIEAVKTGSTHKMDPSLARYYEKLRLIVSGDLLSLERFSAIVAFNLGMYDHWKRDYLYCNDW